MKKFLFLLVILIISCSDYNPSNPNNIRYVSAEAFSFHKYSGKTIKNIYYNKNAETVTGCNDLTINFMDGTRIRIFVYKYDPDIEITK